jgi:hypothetical protein
MAIGERRRLSVVEYGQAIDLAGQIAAAARIDRNKAWRMIDAAGGRIARTLGFNANPIQTDARGTRVSDVAGMIRLAPSLELEIAPKFLGLDESDSGWREDFYFLANLSRHGRLLASERLRASGGAPRDLAALVARALAGMYRDSRRKPLRTYRTMRETSFAIEGDIDPFDLQFPDADGFAQDVIRYDRRNPFNASIVGAAKALLPDVSDPIAVKELSRVIEDLPQQGRPDPFRARNVPGRSRAWKPTIDLSNDILSGLGLSYKSGAATAPGYVIGTWQAWEHLLVVAARFGFGRNAVRVQAEHTLGIRRRSMSAGDSPLKVFPDLLITADSRFILDAKYKTNSEKGRLRISEADTYEALAFSKATDCEIVVLAYPALPGKERLPLGQVLLFEQIEIDKIRIYGVQVEVRGISQKGGLTAFSGRMHSGLTALLSSAEG